MKGNEKDFFGRKWEKRNVLEWKKREVLCRKGTDVMGKDLE